MSCEKMRRNNLAQYRKKWCKNYIIFFTIVCCFRVKFSTATTSMLIPQKKHQSERTLIDSPVILWRMFQMNKLQCVHFDSILRHCCTNYASAIESMQWRFDQLIYCWFKQIYKIPICKAFEWTTILNSHPLITSMKRVAERVNISIKRAVEKQREWKFI